MYGDVYDSEGLKVRHVSGAWNEAFENEDVVCIWRAGKHIEDLTRLVV